MSDDLVAFIEARLDEDERTAQDAIVSMSDTGEWRAHHTRGLSTVKERGYFLVASDFAAEAAEHAARHDPSRVLRDVGALRAVVEECKSTMEWCAEMRAEGRPHDAYARHVGSLLGVLQTFAAVWREHPDFRPEWSPTDG